MTRSREARIKIGRYTFEIFTRVWGEDDEKYRVLVSEKTDPAKFDFWLCSSQDYAGAFFNITRWLAHQTEIGESIDEKA